MDPLTQGLLGGVAAQVALGRRLPRSAWWLGVLAGMSADLDIFIRPAGDPLGGLTFHRHFTHALAFVPLGALLSAALFLPLRTFAGHRWAVLAAALIGYATHGLLDATTSYGTLLWWPFSNTRVAWDLIAIIDPLFTFVLLAGLVVSVLLRRPRVAGVALGLALAYLGLGGVQNQRALAVQHQLAATRGHVLERGRAMPTFANLVLWRCVYVADGRVYTDSIRVPLLGTPEVHTGTSVPLVTESALLARHGHDEVTRLAIRRFVWFADGYTAYDMRDPTIVGDMRYTLRPDDPGSMWGLWLPPDGLMSPSMVRPPGGGRRDALARLWDGIMGRDARYRSLATVLAAGGH